MKYLLGRKCPSYLWVIGLTLLSTPIGIPTSFLSVFLWRSATTIVMMTLSGAALCGSFGLD